MESVDVVCCSNETMPALLSGLRVLIVDDDPDTLFLFEMTFEHVGATVLMADSVDEALQAIECHQPNVLVSDIQMPGGDGYALIQKLRALEVDGRAKLPAIAVTAHARDVDRNEAIAAGFDRFLTKPVDLDVLIAAISDLVPAG